MDKILTEAFDKLKAIEESDDPFCIGELSENEEDAEDEIVEGEHEDDRAVKCSNCGAVNDTDDMRGDTSCHECGKDVYSGQEGGRGEMDEATDDTNYDDMGTEPSSYAIETESGHEYSMHIQQDGGKERAFIEADGIPIATFTVGGGGAMDVRIQNQEEVMNALAFAIKYWD